MKHSQSRLLKDIAPSRASTAGIGVGSPTHFNIQHTRARLVRCRPTILLILLPIPTDRSSFATVAYSRAVAQK